MNLQRIYQDASEVCQRVSLSEIRDKSILVTGASGLLGTHLMASLGQLQNSQPSRMKVFAVCSSHPSDYFQNLCQSSGAEIISGDLTKPDFQSKLPAVDYIIHAAGYGQPGRFLKFPIETLQLNTAATFALFEKLNPKGKFLFVGTSEVYVGLQNSPHHESQIGQTNTDHPRACYIEAKRCGEAICHSFRRSGVDAKIARLALAYGPGTRPGDKRALHSFIEQGLNGKITLLDHGLARRTYCYVSDAIEVLWNILLRGRESVYNVGGISRTTIRDLALLLGSLMKVPVEFPSDVHKLEGAPEDVHLDLSRIENEFGKVKFVSLKDGLRRTIEWQRAFNSNSSSQSVAHG